MRRLVGVLVLAKARARNPEKGKGKARGKGLAGEGKGYDGCAGGDATAAGGGTSGKTAMVATAKVPEAALAARTRSGATSSAWRP